MEKPTPFDLNRALANWRRQLVQSRRFTDEQLDELESHLRDAVTGVRRTGVTEEQAFQHACERLGQTRELASEFAKVELPLKRPLALIVVGVVFLLMGTHAVWNAITTLAQGITPINPYVLFLPVGIGLLRLKRGWRTAAIVCLWIYFALLLFVVGLVFRGGHGVVSLYGVDLVKERQYWLAGTSLAGVTALLAWMHWVLARPDVKNLFRKHAV